MEGKHTPLCCHSTMGKAAPSLWLCQGQIYIHYEIPTHSYDTTIQQSIHFHYGTTILPILNH